MGVASICYWIPLINHPFGGVPPFMETPTWDYWTNGFSSPKLSFHNELSQLRTVSQARGSARVVRQEVAVEAEDGREAMGGLSSAGSHFCGHMGVSINVGTPKSCTLMGFSLINHPFGGSPISRTPHM